MSESTASVVRSALVSTLLATCVLFGGGCTQRAVRAATETVVLDQYMSLQDGASRTYKVRAGTYRLELTATNDGATVQWYGATCQAAPSETHVFNSNCTLLQDGQLKIANPTIFGLGSATAVTVKLTVI